jgi:hypothetical protein
MNDIISGYPRHMYKVKCRFYQKGVDSNLCYNYKWNCKVYDIRGIDKKEIMLCSGEVTMDHIQYLIYRGF